MGKTAAPPDRLPPPETSTAADTFLGEVYRGSPDPDRGAYNSIATINQRVREDTQKATAKATAPKFDPRAL
jgi:hypothetical protein